MKKKSKEKPQAKVKPKAKPAKSAKSATPATPAKRVKAKLVKKPIKKPRKPTAAVSTLDFPNPTFPVAGGQNCFPGGATSLTATGTVPDSGAVVQVQLYIGNNPPITVAPTVTGTTWNANFPTATPAALANTPCRLVVIGVDGTDRITLGLEFIHQPSPAQISLTGIPAANHTTNVSGTATHADMLTLAVDGVGVPITFNPDGSFSVLTPSTSNATQDLLFEATNASGEDAKIDFTLNVDQVQPTFDPIPTPTTSPEAIIFASAVNDPDSPTNPASGFDPANIQFSASVSGPGPATCSVTTTPIDALSFSYEVTVPTPPTPGAYSVLLTATDIAGNQASTTVSFSV